MFYEQVKELAVEPFARLTGVKPETFKVMVETLCRAEETKHKSGRPSKFSTENQVLMTLMHLRENRTYFHIGHTYGVHTSMAYRITRHVEDTLSKEEALKLPGKNSCKKVVSSFRSLS